MYLTGDFITRIYRDLSQLNNEKKNSPIWKWTKENKNTPLLKKSGQRIWIESTLLQRNTQMASEHEKRCSTSLVNREMQMTTAVRYHFTPSSQLKKKTDRHTHTHKERQTLQMLRWSRLELSYIAGGKCKMVQPPWKTAWQFLNKIHAELPWDPAIPLLSIRESKIFTQTKMCTQMYTVSSLKVAKDWKRPKRPSVKE